MTTERRWC